MDKSKKGFTSQSQSQNKLTNNYNAYANINSSQNKINNQPNNVSTTNKKILNEVYTNNKITGSLEKLKTTGCTLFSNKNLRYFELDFKNEFFGYKVNQKDATFKAKYNLNDFILFISKIPSSGNSKSKINFKNAFYVKFRGREFTLFATNSYEYEIWVESFIRVNNIFIIYKEMNPLAFKKALELFDKASDEVLSKEKQTQEENQSIEKEQDIKKIEIEKETNINFDENKKKEDLIPLLNQQEQISLVNKNYESNEHQPYINRSDNAKSHQKTVVIKDDNLSGNNRNNTNITNLVFSKCN